MHFSDPFSKQRAASEPGSAREAHLPPLHTSPERFFRQHIHPIPEINLAYWSFMLGGLVMRPVLLSYDDLLSASPTEQPTVLACIGNPPGGPLIASARWTGVPLSDLLTEARVHHAVQHAHLYAADGYATSIPLEWAQRALLAHHMNDAPIPPEHGGPVRVIVPGLYGYKMPKWIQRIVLAETPLPGVWEQRGWSPMGIVQTTTGIVTPQHLEPVHGPVLFTGIAYAGTRAVTRVEISVENGPWTPADLVSGPPGMLTRWHALWTPSAPGDYRVSARATDETGSVQPETGATFPNGATAAHAIVVRVVSS